MTPNNSFSTLSTFICAMEAFSRAHGRDELPWRQPGMTPYGIWVSEVMLQQTQVMRVIPYFQAFMERFPHVFSLAAASWDDFLPLYRGLGYYRRGENMLACARLVVEQHDGVFPRDRKQLKALPGIGDYTASAILSFGYGEPVLAFDTNMQKVFGRFLQGSRKAVVDKEALEGSLVDLFRQRPMGWFNGAVMDFAGAVCRKVPLCASCPVRTHCRYFAEEGRQETVAVKAGATPPFPMGSAQVHLWLHRAHRHYFSVDPDRFVPFILPPGVNRRHQIKAYFMEQYGLELAVRPPHARGFLEGMPVLLVNAQVLQGQAEFAAFTREEVREYGETITLKGSFD
ncbi:HhH-GPD family protein [Desulfurispirillum indicum S5]|uniref:Adenine DNA glycosylase n=1 Tax=Desulfurispirillum indicum (strain ATCC BAA-1389 / DSM 22839 / S5) TaxID=653733 RepID=E6W5U9_DESIS|nr:A/G-specific adenine glycosylase [Desulfurispirillum indicum]ADU67234.1 HhH-GPD family protein [Desulfurispirillum indicum S5]